MQNILKYIFPVPKVDSPRVVSFVNRDDYISFRNHVYEKNGDKVRLKEIGPRFEMRLYQVRLGTLDQTHADSEFSLRPYINTARKRRYLSEGNAYADDQFGDADNDDEQAENNKRRR